VDIKPESSPVPGEDFFLIYDHPYSFEASSWLQAGRSADSPHCIMNAGYSSGWCEQSFGIELTAVEVSCRARGDPSCTFVMAPPSRIAGRLEEHFGAANDAERTGEIYIPTYFDRKRAEEAVREQAEELRQAYEKLNAAHQELKATQVEAIQSGRLASIGALAAGVAHELNSPLCVVQGYANLLVEQLALGVVEADFGSLARKVNKIKTASERCKVIVDDLLAFSRQSKGAMCRVVVADVVKQTFDLIGVHFRRARIGLHFDVPAEVAVWGNSSQLQQVVTNIAMNSAQAMDRTGELRVRVAPAPEDGGQVLLEISDTGPGIAGEHLDRIFDPFFTTKPPGEGTGLGLAIVYGIVESHGGQINVDTTVGSGTTFRIVLPAG